ncbi:OmpA family protein [Teredinibacter waterburyi]|jgi:Outer membrane protein and related peptidoglycan-associated (lipo)proteins|uniref:OmpA family protein n=1 Tax=Teredinibacter waterburyi TaxID=1500538 RepID=UPI00165F01C9|nr:OmpA family protein [Teredinibacter waterburyi]
MNSRRSFAKKLINLTVLNIVAGATLASSVAATAEEQSGFNISPMIGALSRPAGSGLTEAVSATLAAGYEFKSGWGAELAYLIADADLTGSDDDAAISQARLDVLYHFNGDDGFRPFLLLGGGNADFSYDNSALDNSEGMVNLGAGFKQAIGDNWALRSDIRAIRLLDMEKTQGALNIGLSYYFGGGSGSGGEMKKAAVETDSDGDGVLDRTDACPGTPAGDSVDTAGCTIVVDMNSDMDNDGVADAMDACPDTEAGAKVDARGCYRLLKESVSVALEVKFANNSDVVVSNSLDDVAKVANFMREYPVANVELKGFTDSRGDAGYNKSLSQRRANAIAGILIEQFGIDASRVSATGYGEDQPIATNETAEGRAQNRRVEAEVSATVEKVVK